jgi:YbbR domain-containing protein
MLSDLPPVTQVRYRAPLDVGVVSPTSFSATVDLSRVQAQPGGPAQNVPVTVIALNSQIQVVDYQPREIPIQLDPVATKDMPVTAVVASVPDGVSTGPPQVDPSSVTITGASSRVDIVTSVVARVSVDASGINIDREVDLVAVDSNSNQVPNVEIDPPRAHVTVAVARQLANVTLPVVPQITGDPAVGYRIASVTVEPLTATVSGEAGTVSQLENVMTEPIDLSGRSADLEATVPLALPDGVTVTGDDMARVVVTLAEVTGTQTFQVGLEMAGQDAANSYALSQSSVQVVLGGPVATLDAVDASQLVATLNVSALASGAGAVEVPVSFTAPAGLEIVSMTPNNVMVTVSTALAPSVPPSIQP